MTLPCKLSWLESPAHRIAQKLEEFGSCLPGSTAGTGGVGWAPPWVSCGAPGKVSDWHQSNLCVFGTSASFSSALGTLEAGLQHYLHLKSAPMKDGPGAVKGRLLPLCSGVSFTDRRRVFSGRGTEAQNN